MSDTEFENVLQVSETSAVEASACHGESSCCQTGPAIGDNPHHDHDHDHAERTDGAGEPCPAPLMWQDVREGFLSDSRLWETLRGPHRLSVRVLGNGPALYFLNNFAATAELFSLCAWVLRDRFRCVVFDATTESRSAARRGKSTMREFAADLLAIADHFGDERFALYGAGFGAAVGLQVALEQPDRISSMILQHGFCRRRLSVFERLLASICLSSGQLLDQLPQRRRFQAVNHKPWFPPFDPSRFDFLIESTGTLPLRDLARRAIAVHSFDIADRLPTLRCPITLLRTEGEGRLADAAQVVLEKGLRQPRVEWMHSAGQHPYLTHPHRVAKLIENVLSDGPR